jgi:hypothetical protein
MLYLKQFHGVIDAVLLIYFNIQLTPDSNCLLCFKLLFLIDIYCIQRGISYGLLVLEFK